MTKIGIIICARYKDCGGGKCFRALRERVGAFAAYPPGEEVEVVGYSTCGGCPGGNVEYVPAEFKKNGATVVHLATGLVVGYPPCPNLRRFKAFIEAAFGLPVVIGTHPIPQKYMDVHARLPFWKESRMEELAGALMEEDPKIKTAYN
ncbi:MAG: CGGC domain-containing protein [Candidatus Aminicenantes bacterium]|nr:CGGC domain-containing protein [Candidatus Aminicenantes bacterium]